MCPAWYGDETLIHHTSLNLTSGIPSNFALWNTFWHPHYPYQPAYSFINGLFGRAAGGDILGSRFFNALLALGCAWAVVLIGWQSLGRKAALFSALMFLCYSQSIVHFRMSYVHNGAGIGLLLMTLFLMRRSTPASDWLSGLGLLVAAGSHPLFIHGAGAAVLCRLLRPKSWVRMLLPSILYVLISLATIYWILGGWLFEDLKHLAQTYTLRGETDGGGSGGLKNFAAFVLQDSYHFIMLAGLILFFPLRKPAPAIVGLVVLYLLVRNRQNLIVFYYQAIVILPVLTLGWAGLWGFGETMIRRFFPRMLPAMGLLAIAPMFLFFDNLPASISGTLKPRNFYWTTQSTEEVEAAAAWLNARTGPGDLVAANPNIAWLLKANTVPYLQMITWYGYPTQGYENRNPKERFRFDSSLEKARYAVIGDIDVRWTFGEPNVSKIAEWLITEKWPVVWQGENYRILKNPD